MKHMLAVALLAALVCLGESSAISRTKAHSLPTSWKELAILPKSERVERALSMLKTPRNALDDQIIAIIEACLQNPALDPVEIPYINIAIHESFADLDGHFDTVTMSGISSLTINNLHVTVLTLKLDLDLTLPYISLRGNYDLDGVLGNILPIYGTGPFLLSATNFTVKATAGMKLPTDGTIQLTKLTIDLGLESFLFDFKYLLGSEDLSDVVNQMINDIGMAFLTSQQVAIEEAVSRTLMNAINNAGINLGDITGGGGDGGEGGPGFCSAPAF